MNDVGLGSAGLGEVVDVPVDLTGVRLDPHLTQPAIAHDPVLVVTNEPLEGNKNEMKGSAQFVKVIFFGTIKTLTDKYFFLIRNFQA